LGSQRFRENKLFGFFTKLFRLYIFHQTVAAYSFPLLVLSALKMSVKWIFTFALSFALV